MQSLRKIMFQTIVKACMMHIIRTCPLPLNAEAICKGKKREGVKGAQVGMGTMSYSVQL